jgi:hypothetical protein
MGRTPVATNLKITYSVSVLSEEFNPKNTACSVFFKVKIFLPP